jgi:hypothetical protein
MRTTVRLDERLLREAKQFAARNGRTLTAVIDDALRQLLARAETRPAARPFRIRAFKGGTGLAPGVDLDDSAALLDRMEKRR